MTPPRPPCIDSERPEVLPLSAERVAEIAKSLAHPARVRIVAQFAEGVPHSVREIVDGCTLAQSTVSEHLRILRKAGVLSARKDGPRVWYCLQRSVLHHYAEAVAGLSDVALRPVWLTAASRRLDGVGAGPEGRPAA